MKQVFSCHPKTLIIDALLQEKAFLYRFSQEATKNANLVRYVSKQIFSSRAKTLIFDALLRRKAGFLMTRPKTKCTFDALLRLVAGFIKTHQNSYI